MGFQEVLQEQGQMETLLLGVSGGASRGIFGVVFGRTFRSIGPGQRHI